jgi:hypothetical protein
MNSIKVSVERVKSFLMGRTPSEVEGGGARAVERRLRLDSLLGPKFIAERAHSMPGNMGSQQDNNFGRGSGGEPNISSRSLAF